MDKQGEMLLTLKLEVRLEKNVEAIAAPQKALDTTKQTEEDWVEIQKRNTIANVSTEKIEGFKKIYEES